MRTISLPTKIVLLLLAAAALFLSALSFKIFGVSTVACKLQSLLAMFLGFYATYRLGELLFDKLTGRLAACMLCSCEAFIFFTNDVRTDALLAGAVIFGIWQVTAFLKTNKTVFSSADSAG
jgi:4-amino-4-deoxy-L-arabinose transferase-like glycosyltransferase